MKKSLLVITLVVLGCSFALAQAPGTYSFWDSAGTLEYCNFNVITTNSGGVVAGYDNTTTGCFYSYNSPIVGFSATTPADGLPAHGKGAVVGDASMTMALSGTLAISGPCSSPRRSAKRNMVSSPARTAGLALLASYTGTYFGDNYGYLGAGYPEKGAVAGHGTTAGTGHGLLRK